jgi:hypothetical protein
MTDPGRPAAEKQPGAQHDIRDDYDDEFRRALSPREIARRLVFVPGVAFVAIGVLLTLGLFVGAAAGVVDWVQAGRRGGEWLYMLLLLFWVLGFGLPLFALVIAGGLCLINLQRYRLALTAAYVVTGLSIAGFWAILFFPFGIWALILLYQPSVRQEFRPPARLDP